MIPRTKLGSKALALCLLTSLSACGPSIEVAVPVKAPPISRQDSATCRDGQLSGDAISDLVDHRLALAECRRKHARVVAFYNSVVGTAQ